ncbi:hypothetical protein [Microlunatus flavus]|uniref:hypothetical protein n=1 Tax=Microlunatus flavus TaxID=1036181 RepID=UPI000B8427A6|nr:hypothetical protein [Microlunatus flavus]
MPIVDAVEWEPWLESQFSRAAHAAGLGYDGGEEEDDFEVHDFFDGDNAAEVGVVQRLVLDVLTRRKKPRTVTATGSGEVTVAEAPDSPWLRALIPSDHSYLRAVHRRAKAACSDPQLRDWWSESGYKGLWFQLRPLEQPKRPWPFSREPGQILFTLAAVAELAILDEERPARAAVRAAAEQTIDAVLRQTAAHLGRPLPV